MVRIRSLLIFFCCLTMLMIWSCKQGSQAPAPSTSTGATVTGTSDTGEKGPSGVGEAPPCNTKHMITLHVNDTDDTVSAAAESVFYKDCVRWQADNGGKIKKIRFMNGDQDLNDYGGNGHSSKVKNKKTIADPCDANGDNCFLYISKDLPEDLYYYGATVNHRGKDKKSDPELAISGGTVGHHDHEPPKKKH